MSALALNLTTGTREVSKVVAQLRIFKVCPGRMDEWLTGWREKVVPLRRKFGFEVRGAWVDREENRFVWLLSLQGPGEWKTRDDAYYASQERRAPLPDPAECISEAESFFVESVGFG